MENDAIMSGGATRGIDENTLAELRRRLGTLAGEDVSLTDQQILNFFYPVGVTTYTDGSVTFRNLIFPRQFCRDATLLDASGQAFTSGSGNATFLLSGILCSIVNSFDGPVNLEATPVTVSPIYVTSQHALVPDPGAPGSFNDLKITLMAWAADGSPAPEVAVDWRCRLVSFPVIL